MKLPEPPFFKTRRRQERFWVTVVALLTVFFGFMEGWFFQLQSELPFMGNISLFALINVNVILLLLLAYLVLRNIVKLLFERKRNILGHKLRTRLVIAFVGLTLIPTIPLFWLATQFIFSSLEYWFSHQVEQSLEQSVSLAREYLDQGGNDL
ncbi:MAG: PAS domain-containing sensor histidine kinase, partial [Syntrophobacteraceae bacterium]